MINVKRPYSKTNILSQGSILMLLMLTKSRTKLSTSWQNQESQPTSCGRESGSPHFRSFVAL